MRITAKTLIGHRWIGFKIFRLEFYTNSKAYIGIQIYFMWWLIAIRFRFCKLDFHRFIIKKDESEKWLECEKCLTKKYVN